MDIWLEYSQFKDKRKITGWVHTFTEEYIIENSLDQLYMWKSLEAIAELNYDSLSVWKRTGKSRAGVFVKITPTKKRQIVWKVKNQCLRSLCNFCGGKPMKVCYEWNGKFSQLMV